MKTTTVKPLTERTAALEREMESKRSTSEQYRLLLQGYGQALKEERDAREAAEENIRSNTATILSLQAALAAEKSRAEDALRRAGAAEAGENRMRQECDRRAEWNADATLENRRLKDDLERERRKDTHRSGVVTGLQRAIALAHGHLSAK